MGVFHGPAFHQKNPHDRTTNRDCMTVDKYLRLSDYMPRIRNIVLGFYS
jgi:hypothetical protein